MAKRMTKRDYQVAILNELHAAEGRCSHCNGLKCPGRQQWSRLPDRLSTDNVVKALQKVLGGR